MTVLLKSLVLTMIVAVSAGWAQEMKADDIIARHLESIGKPEKRAALNTLIAGGSSSFEARMPAVKGGGKAVVVSNPDNLFFQISLNSREYPFEKIGYFGGKIELPFTSAGARSLLGVFLNEHQKMLSEGLFGGTMSMRWALLNTGRTNPKMKLSGSKKIDGRKMYVLDYIPLGVGSTDFTVRLFFDAETFDHVRSEYRREVVVGRATFGQANQQANAVIVLTEDFADHKDIDGIRLPHTYRVKFSSNSNATSNESIWGINVSQYYFNQKLQPDFFTFDTK